MTIDNVFPNCLGWAQMCQALESHCVWTMTFYVLCLRCKRFELELQGKIFFLSVNILALKLAIVALTYKRYACSVSSIYYIICLQPDTPHSFHQFVHVDKMSSFFTLFDVSVIVAGHDLSMKVIYYSEHFYSSNFHILYELFRSI